jgi:serine/threonine protein kinase
MTPGSHIKKYELLEQIGEGGMGVVWKAYDHELQSTVAIKQILPELSASAKIRAQFIESARLLNTLVHQNISALKDAFDHDDTVYLVQEYVAGRTVKQMLGDTPAGLPQEQAINIAEQVLAGLAFTHRKNVVHCDIKPANIMVTADDEIKIIDFGIAQSLENAVRQQTGTRTVIGTPAYMSPEQLTGQVLDPRSDIFSFGVTLWEMLTGKLRFGASGLGNAEEPWHTVETLADHLPAAIERATARRREDRFDSAEDFSAALRPGPSVHRWNTIAETRHEQHNCPISRLHIQKRVVTWRDYEEFMRSPLWNPSAAPNEDTFRCIWTPAGAAWQCNNSVQQQSVQKLTKPCQVTWNQAIAYCNWLTWKAAGEPADARLVDLAYEENSVDLGAGYRLPTEAELDVASTNVVVPLQLLEWTSDGWVPDCYRLAYSYQRDPYVPFLHTAARAAWTRVGATPRRGSLLAADSSHRAAFRMVIRQRPQLG